jgi:hypothetical protein
MAHAGTEYTPQWIKMPNLASLNHCKIRHRFTQAACNAAIEKMQSGYVCRRRAHATAASPWEVVANSRSSSQGCTAPTKREDAEV